MLYYCDGLPILVVAVIAVHHVSFFMMQQAGLPVYVFNRAGHGWSMVFVHAACVVVEPVLLAVMAIDVRKSAMRGEALDEMAGALTRGEEGRINLTFRRRWKDSLVQQQRDVNYIANAIAEMSRAVHDVSSNAEKASASANAADRDSKAGIAALYQAQQEIQGWPRVLMVPVRRLVALL